MNRMYRMDSGKISGFHSVNSVHSVKNPVFFGEIWRQKLLDRKYRMYRMGSGKNFGEFHSANSVNSV